MAVRIQRPKCDYILNLDESLDTFFTVFKILDDGSVISKFRNKNWRNLKLNSNINLGEIRYLEVPDIID